MDARPVVYGLAMALLLASAPTVSSASAGVPLGVSFASLDEVKTAGVTPAYTSYWVGDWMADSGWGGLERMLNKSKAAGVTPVLYWYYWGDSISPTCVEHGCDGRTRAEWDSLTRTLASKVRTHMGGAPTYIVLENEFNKGGITGTYAPKFDAYLEAKAKELKAVPGVRIILGYGAWGEDKWGLFPRAIAASDHIGFQMMRASTKDTETSYRAATQRLETVLDRANELAPGKGAFLYDLALSSYSGDTWRRVQKETMAALLAKGDALAAEGLKGIIYREVRDNPSMSLANYYGIAEQYWGLRDRDGNAKPAWDVWVAAAKDGASTLPPPPPPPPAFSASFGPKPGNEWWIETTVAANQPLRAVCASVAGGACQPLALKSWGAWAASIHVQPGQSVTFRATSTTGESAASAPVVWVPEPFRATFTPYDGNANWVQTRVAANEPVKSVCASVNGGACQALTLRSWGAWAAGLSAPAGSEVVFRATSSDGDVASSGSYTWPVG